MNPVSDRTPPPEAQRPPIFFAWLGKSSISISVANSEIDLHTVRVGKSLLKYARIFGPMAGSQRDGPCRGPLWTWKEASAPSHS